MNILGLVPEPFVETVLSETCNACVVELFIFFFFFCKEVAGTAQLDTTHCAPTAGRVQRRIAAGSTRLAAIVGNHASALIPVGSSNDATYVTVAVAALLATCAKIRLDTAPGIKTRTLEFGRSST